MIWLVAGLVIPCAASVGFVARDRLGHAGAPAAAAQGEPCSGGRWSRGRDAEDAVNTAAFLRISTTDQTTANQLMEIEQLCRHRGWSITATYREQGVSGDARDRPELSRMLADAHAGKFGVLVVWALDRLSRRGIAEVSGIIAKLDRAGVALVSVKVGQTTLRRAARMLDPVDS